MLQLPVGLHTGAGDKKCIISTLGMCLELASAQAEGSSCSHHQAFLPYRIPAVCRVTVGCSCHMGSWPWHGALGGQLGFCLQPADHSILFCLKTCYHLSICQLKIILFWVLALNTFLTWVRGLTLLRLYSPRATMGGCAREQGLWK